MNFLSINDTDLADSTNGICISLWFAGCDIRCKGCHNSAYWEIKNDVKNQDVIDSLKKLFDKSPIEKSFSILGGEPLASFNRKDCKEIVLGIRELYPNKYIRLWTGRTKEQLLKESLEDNDIGLILSNVNEIIVGPFIEELKEQLPLRGSSNQEILKLGQDYFVQDPKEPTGNLALKFEN